MGVVYVNSYVAMPLKGRKWAVVAPDGTVLEDNLDRRTAQDNAHNRTVAAVDAAQHNVTRP